MNLASATRVLSEKCAGQQVLGHYKGLLDVEEAFCQLKSYLEVRPVHHRRPDRNKWDLLQLRNQERP